MNAPERKPVRMPPARSLSYDGDYYAWTQDQGERLKAHRPEGLDWENLAEEVESFGRSQKREIESSLTVLLAHLLKWEHQPTRRSGSWRATIAELRDRIARELEDSPSLRGHPAGVLTAEYRLARMRAAADMGIAPSELPEDCPYSAGEALDPEFLPGSPEA
ncbi:DUF29 domain-containing protein [Prosthecomicrobium sp. N25]|uniref:DUF29 domain-containing protein n=1 Tax=Prosthecomicrobium sp. N25 TaxID=3129254 RepID=UPI003077B152